MKKKGEMFKAGDRIFKRDTREIIGFRPAQTSEQGFVYRDAITNAGTRVRLYDRFDYAVPA